MTQMKQYTQYIYKDGEWRVLGTPSSGNADWQENNSSADSYIENRTHYIENESEIEETINSITFTSGYVTNTVRSSSFLIQNYEQPQEGDFISFTINNQTFSGNLKIYPFSSSSYGYGEPYYYIGNMSLEQEDFIDTGESFLLYVALDNYTISDRWTWNAIFLDTVVPTGSYSIDFLIKQTIYQKLNKEYIPYEKGENNIVLNDLNANIVNGTNSLAEGQYTAATGNASHAEGMGYPVFDKQEISYLQEICNFTIVSANNEDSTLIIDDQETFASEDLVTYLDEDEVLLYVNPLTKAASASEYLGILKKVESYSEGNLIGFKYFIDNTENKDLTNYVGATLEFYVTLYEGYTWAAGGASHAEGCVTHATGAISHAEGNYTIASGTSSHAEGSHTLAQGSSSHAEGQSTEATGARSHAEGYTTHASGEEGHAEGYNTTASGNFSHAEGYNSSATAVYSHAEGYSTQASHGYAHAEGANTKASGQGSHAEGYYTEAKSTYQHVQGKYNIVDNNNTYADIIGNGSSDSSRSNAATVDWNGNAWYAGKVIVGSGPTDNMDVATKKYVDDSLIDELPTFYISSNSASNPFVVKANEIGHYVFKPTVNSIYIKMETSGSTNRVINFNELIVFDNNPANGAEFAYCWYPASGGIARVMLIANSSLDGGIGWSGSTSGFGNYALKTYVDDAIAALPEPMIFKGSLGTGGTITSLPTASSENEGFTYKVITAGTYASQTAKIGDTFISDGTTWILIPSGDEPSGTVTSVKIQATSPIAIDSDAAITTSGTRTLSHADSGVSAGTYKSVTVDAKGHVTGGSNPTTLSGYGITDAKINNGVITLGSNTITPLTSEVNSNLLNNTATGSLRTIGCVNDYTVGTYSFAEGRGSRAYGENSHAEGNNSYSVGSNSHAEGAYSYAKGSGAHAEGFGAKYSGISGTITSIDTTNHQVSVNFGSDLSTIYNSTVGGILSDANSYYNVSYRITNVSKNSNDNYTFTTDSVANWQVNTVLYLWLTSSALGISSHAEGQGCIAWHENTHAEGIGTITGNASQHVQGKWNAYAQNMADIVGNGTDAKHRSNAYTLDWDGNGVYAGKVTVGSGPTNNMDVATKQYVDTAVSGVTPTLPNASSTVVGGIKVRYDADTYTLYMTNDGTDA